MRTEAEISKRAWRIAFDHHLSEYPKDVLPEIVLELIETMSDDVVVWEPFENNDKESLIENIKVTQRYMESELLWATGEES